MHHQTRLGTVQEMAVSVVRQRNDIISLQRRMLDHFKPRDGSALKARMDAWLDYLLDKFARASAGRAWARMSFSLPGKKSGKTPISTRIRANPISVNYRSVARSGSKIGTT